MTLHTVTDVMSLGTPPPPLKKNSGSAHGGLYRKKNTLTERVLNNSLT